MNKVYLPNNLLGRFARALHVAAHARATHGLAVLDLDPRSREARDILEPYERAVRGWNYIMVADTPTCASRNCGEIGERKAQLQCLCIVMLCIEHDEVRPTKLEKKSHRKKCSTRGWRGPAKWREMNGDNT